jgi:hypothetical protein
MPKHGEMSQISRPFQIVLLAAGVLMAVWFVALRGHSPSSNSASSGGAPAAAAATPGQSPGSASSVYHGSAPGVEGLSRAIAKAHGAVATSQQNAKELAQKSAQASVSGGTAATTAPPAAAHATASVSAAAGSSAAVTHKVVVTHKVTVHAVSPAHGKSAGSLKGVQRTPARQALVERALKEGKIAVILFWNNRGADDRAVNLELQLLEAVHHVIKPRANTPRMRAELRAYGLELDKPFAAFVARANEVTSFGTITHGVQVYGTPTILVVNKKGSVRTITGLTDAYSIEQTIDEARHG